MEKIVLIKEEIVALTESTQQAILLNQFLYWARRKETDKWLQEEAENYLIKTNFHTKKHGWVYKSARELKEEVMLTCSEETLRKYLIKLVGQGYLDVRNNPIHKWDKTKQYRVNLSKIFRELEDRGYEMRAFDDFKGIVSSILKKVGIDDKKTCDRSPKIVGAISDITTESNSFNDEEKIIHVFQNLQNQKIRDNDVKHVRELIQLDLSIDEKLLLLEKCFSDFQAKKKGDKINSFKYVLNYVKYHIENNKESEESTNATDSKNNRSNAQAVTQKMSVDQPTSISYKWDGSVDVDF